VNNVVLLHQQSHLHAAIGAAGEQPAEWIHVHLADALASVLEEPVLGMLMRERIDQHELIHVPDLQDRQGLVGRSQPESKLSQLTFMSPSMEPVTKNSSCGSRAMHLMVLSWACQGFNEDYYPI